VNISHKEHEPNYTMHLKSFLDCILLDNLIETQGRTDLIIRKGKTKADNAVILFEVKTAMNKSEMITKDNLNKKAFHEIILYFMRERLGGNTDIKHLIINTQTEFYILKAQDFEALFFNNTQFKKDFIAFEAKEKTGSKTDFFYDHIAKPFIDKIDAKIPVTYFDLNDYKEFLNQPNDKTAEKKLEYLYKIFTPEFLFNKPLKNDNNSLNKEFYSELLYIMGLHETKENNKYVIQRLPKTDRNPASLIENTILKIQQKRKFEDLDIINRYGLNVDERRFNIALELCLVWVNRLLFLKLLEAQIVSYHSNNPDYKFLNLDKIQDYDDLSDLFFEILAKKIPIRNPHLQDKFKHIPYLNSSLFEVTEPEGDSFSISMLNNNDDLPIYKNTVLKTDNKPLYQNLRTLDYIFKFLDAYNFSSDNDDTIQDAPKTIISASVLGLIFEKINGYKDGSIFTPSYITMYMSKQVIEQAVIHKFKEKYNDWNFQTIDDLKNKLMDYRDSEDIKEQNKVFNSLKICDPAVGSGHFLVSCLNEMIYIKFYLGILADKDGRRISDCDISLENDEIIIL
jgi:adenine-specific DNA-methyltransferase